MKGYAFIASLAALVMACSAFAIILAAAITRRHADRNWQGFADRFHGAGGADPYLSEEVRRALHPEAVGQSLNVERDQQRPSSSDAHGLGSLDQ